MGLNFKEALAAVSRAFADFLVQAGVFVASGFLVLLEFGALLMAVRFARVSGPAAVPLMAALIVLGGGLTVAACRRLFLCRRQAAMLFAFAGKIPEPLGGEFSRFFPNGSSWVRTNRRLRQALSALRRNGEPAASRPGACGRLAETIFLRSILALAASRDGADATRALGEGLALYWRQGVETRMLAKRWLGFSALALTLLFAVLALANALVFRGAGAPLAIGIALAAAIAWTLHQAFFSPLALAGVSAALIEETRGREPDPELSGRIAALFIP